MSTESLCLRCGAPYEPHTYEDATCGGFIDVDAATSQALVFTADAFRQFSRNGRWGTCSGCPRDSERHAYPEFCKFTERYDHRLTIEQLADHHNNRLIDWKRR